MDILNLYETMNKYRKSMGSSQVTSLPSMVFEPKSIVLLSSWPFFNDFKSFLLTLLRITKSVKSPLPIERYLMNFMHEVPVPPQGKTSVQFVVGDTIIKLKRNPPNELPFCYVNGLNIFRCLSHGNVLTLFNCILQEKKIVLISDNLYLLLEVSETIQLLLFPFSFQGVYMPILPATLLDFLHSPVPFMAGIKHTLLLYQVLLIYNILSYN